MTDISNLLFKREHFPIGTGKFDLIVIPPYHPLIQDNGIDTQLVLSTIAGSLEEAVKDLKNVAKKRSGMSGIRDTLRGMTSSEDGTVSYRILGKDESSVSISFPPFFNTLYIGRKTISPAGEGGSPYLTINKGKIPSFFSVPESVTFPAELMEEYSMTEQSGPPGYKQIEFTPGWRSHNLGYVLQIFLKNIIIGIDNATVTKKYSQQS